jgi:hypothetical protein
VRTRAAERAASPRTAEAFSTVTGAEGRTSTGFVVGVAVAVALRVGVASAVGDVEDVGAVGDVESVGSGGEAANDDGGLTVGAGPPSAIEESR